MRGGIIGPCFAQTSGRAERALLQLGRRLKAQIAINRKDRDEIARAAFEIES